MREIEIKAKVQASADLETRLQQLNIVLGGPKKQHDVVFGRTEDGKFLHKDNWLRIRTENDKTVYFTLKRSVTGELDSIEHEVIVDNAAELELLILALGYEPYSDLTKIRRKAKIGDIELCYDEVPELGTFIEAEKLCDDTVDLDSIQQELWKFFEQLNISRDDAVTNGYDVLLRIQQGLDR